MFGIPAPPAPPPAPPPEMPTDVHGARVHVRNVLEEACQRLLRRLVEDDPPDEADGVPECVADLHRSWMCRTPSLDEVTRKLSEICGFGQLPPGVQEVLAGRLYTASQYLQRTSHLCELVKQALRMLRSALLSQEKVDAFFADEWGLATSLFRELDALLGPKRWSRLRLGVGYEARLGAADSSGTPETELSDDKEPCVADPEVQASAGSQGGPEVSACAANTAPEVHASALDVSQGGPEVSACAANTAPEVHASALDGSQGGPEVSACAASAAPEVQRTHLAIGDRKTGVGYYIELQKNPRDEQSILEGRRKLRAILSADAASAPGHLRTEEDRRVCYQIIFYSADELAKGSERPGEMEKLLNRQSSWKHVLDCNHASWKLPRREIGVCILEVKPYY